MKKGGRRGENMSELNRLTEQLFRHMVGRGTDRRGADYYRHTESSVQNTRANFGIGGPND